MNNILLSSSSRDLINPSSRSEVSRTLPYLLMKTTSNMLSSSEEIISHSLENSSLGSGLRGVANAILQLYEFIIYDKDNHNSLSKTMFTM